MVRTGAVVLAAGGGRRFEGAGPKLLAPLGGRPVASWALEAVCDAGFDAVIVVTGAVDLGGVERPDVQVVHNPQWQDGLATSLAAAVLAAGAHGLDAIVVGLADQPGVPAATWRAVADADGGPIVVATYDGQRANPVRLDRVVWPLLPTTGDEGARLLMRERPELVTEIACDGDPSDIDTEEDLRRWS